MTTIHPEFYYIVINCHFAPVRVALLWRSCILGYCSTLGALSPAVQSRAHLNISLLSELNRGYMQQGQGRGRQDGFKLLNLDGGFMF